jgi:hypothetical protein
MAEPALVGVFDLLWGTVLPRVARITVLIAVGVTLADLLVQFGLVRYVAGLSRYLTRPANLPDEVGTAILTSTASATAGYGMLAEFRESGVLSDRATLVAVTVNTFFGFVQHIFTFYAPVLIPILGLKVGLLYVGSRAFITLAITLTGIAAGAVLLSAADREGTARTDRDAATDGGDRDQSLPGEDTPETVRGKLEAAARSGLSKTRDIVPRLVIVYALVSVLTTYSDLTALTAAGDPLADLTGLPSAAIPVIAVFAIDTTNGALVIAPLVEDGVFTARTAVATMLVGGIVSFAVSTFKRSIPFQYGIWGSEFGSKVVVVNTAAKVVWIAVAVAVVLHTPLPV